jgi:hypothetical protein
MILTEGSQRFIMALGLVAYVYTTILYVFTIYIKHDDWIKTINYGLILVGFSLLSYNAFLKIRRNWKQPEKIENPRQFFNKQVMIGWFLIFLHFIYICFTMEVFSYSYYLFIGLIAYGLLAQGRYLGIYFLVIFYVFSIVQHYPTDLLTAAGTVSKVLVGIYMGLYGYLLGFWLKNGQVRMW